MRVSAWIGALVVAVTLAGCATTANYNKVAQSWVGATETDLIRAWGAPQYTYPLPNGDRFLVWDRSSSYTTPTTISPGFYPGYGYWGGPWHGPFYGGVYASPTIISGGEEVHLVCRTEFEVDKEGRVVGYRTEGNNCKAHNPEKDARFRRAQ